MRNTIDLKTQQDMLIINISAQNEDVQPNADIINYSGEILEHLGLKQGENAIDLKPYSLRNLSIRVANGKDIVVQKL